MKPITLHPVSVLAGLVLAGAIFVLAGAAQSHGTVQSIPIHDIRLVGEIPAEWWTYVAVDSTTSYSVPLDRYLVITGSYGGNYLLADGQSVWGTLAAVDYIGLHLGNGTRVTYSPGAVLSTTQGSAQLWGYLQPVG